MSPVVCLEAVILNPTTTSASSILASCSEIMQLSVFCLCLWAFWFLLFTQPGKRRSAARVRKAFTHKDLRASGWKNCVK